MPLRSGTAPAARRMAATLWVSTSMVPVSVRCGTAGWSAPCTYSTTGAVVGGTLIDAAKVQSETADKFGKGGITNTRYGTDTR